MNKIKVIALFGPSGCGKDTLLNYIVNKTGFNKIITTTTRPKREYEKEDVNYHFLTEEEFGLKVLDGTMLEATSFNNWFYGTARDDLKENNINIGVFNIHALECLLQDNNLDITPILIACEDKTRLMRSLNREDKPNCEEICRRFLSDSKDFNVDLDFDFYTYYNGNNVNLENFYLFLKEHSCLSRLDSSIKKTFHI